MQDKHDKCRNISWQFYTGIPTKEWKVVKNNNWEQELTFQHQTPKIIIDDVETLWFNFKMIQHIYGINEFDVAIYSILV